MPSVLTLDPPADRTAYPASRTMRPAAPGPIPGGTVTLLFSDIEGSTRLLQRLGSVDYARALGAHRRLLRAALRTWGGREVDVAGDGCFAVFEHAPHAAAAAVAAQRAFQRYPWPGGVQLRVRMGLHTGEPTRFEDGYVGLDVHRAARICAAARGGQILLSRATRVLVERVLPAGTHLLDRGSYRLKGLDGPEPLAELRANRARSVNASAPGRN